MECRARKWKGVVSAQILPRSTSLALLKHPYHFQWTISPPSHSNVTKCISPQLDHCWWESPHHPLWSVCPICARCSIRHRRKWPLLPRCSDGLQCRYCQCMASVFEGMYEDRANATYNKLSMSPKFRVWCPVGLHRCNLWYIHRRDVVKVLLCVWWGIVRRLGM